MRQMHNDYAKYSILTPPIILKELVSKVVVTPDTESGAVKDLVAVGLADIDTYVSKRLWSPNLNAEAYQKRKEARKRERELDN